MQNDFQEDTNQDQGGDTTMNNSQDICHNYNGTIQEIDLHGYSAAQALSVFIELYNKYVSLNLIGELKIIHGYGSSGKGGIIRNNLRYFNAKGKEKIYKSISLYPFRSIILYSKERKS